jgi:hypothetical protein
MSWHASTPIAMRSPLARPKPASNVKPGFCLLIHTSLGTPFHFVISQVHTCCEPFAISSGAAYLGRLVIFFALSLRSSLPEFETSFLSSKDKFDHLITWENLTTGEAQVTSALGLACHLDVAEYFGKKRSYSAVQPIILALPTTLNEGSPLFY